MWPRRWVTPTGVARTGAVFRAAGQAEGRRRRTACGPAGEAGLGFPFGFGSSRPARDPTMPYRARPHEPDVWLRAGVEKQWRYQGRWRRSVHYDGSIAMQHQRVYYADQCRPVGPQQRRPNGGSSRARPAPPRGETATRAGSRSPEQRYPDDHESREPVTKCAPTLTNFDNLSATTSGWLQLTMVLAPVGGHSLRTPRQSLRDLSPWGVLDRGGSESAAAPT